jgi:SAM-dependent methyltransferase
MLKTARASPSPPNIEFQTASAEDLSFVSDESVDLVIAGQAAHWFDFSKTWSEIGRVLRKDGTVAFWGYKDNVFPDHPRASRVLDHYCYSAEQGMMGPYWEQPGRSILRDLYRSIEPPGELFQDVARREYEQAIEGRRSGKGERIMFRQLSLGEVEGYVRTFSAFANWKEDHRDRKPKAEGGAGDVVDELFEKMLEAEDEWRQKGEAWREKVVETEWGSVMLYARKK